MRLSWPWFCPGMLLGGGVDSGGDPWPGDAGDVGVGGVDERVELQEVSGDGEPEDAASGAVSMDRTRALVSGGRAPSRTSRTSCRWAAISSGAASPSWMAMAK